MKIGAPSLNPGGRPKNGVTAAIRELEHAPAAVANYVLSLLENEAATPADRKWAAEFIADRLDGKPTTTSVSQSIVGSIDLGQQSTPRATLPDDWDQMTMTDQRAYLKSLRNALVK